MNIFMQLVSIAGSICVVLFFWDRLTHMEYSFWHIFVRWAAYKDTKPYDWLIENMEYLGFLMIVTGHMFTVIGLLQQFSLNQVATKSGAFFVSSPINSLGLLLVAYIYSERWAHRTIK